MFPFIGRLMDRLIQLFSRDSGWAFWDTSSFPWIATIEANWKTIAAEFHSLELERIPNFESISDDANKDIRGKPLSHGAEWKWLFLYGYDHRLDSNCELCPETARLAESIPGMRCAIFTILAPGKHIAPHRGLYRGLLRYHLGVRIPGAPEQCRIRVAGETKSWEEGRSLVFDDTRLHEVWNESDEKRVILIVDFERPLITPLAWMNRIILRWIHSTSYVTDAMNKAFVPSRDS